MNQKIIKYLQEIEVQKEIIILLACETGSRAWGFPSTDSDFDIRLIYVNKLDWYLTLTEEKDTLEIMLEDNNLDISGWDLRKTLRLLGKSNPPLLERIQSPIIYLQNDIFLKRINDIAKDCYSRIATIHHYLNMAKNCFEEIENQETYKLKKFFYALRTATACNWIIAKEELPPIHFPTMIDGLNINPDLYKRISDLITLKAQKDESYFHRGENELINYIKESIAKAEIKASQLPASKGKISELNDFFRQIIKQEI